ncbi:MAG TPA: DUF4202 domain-containing protein [Tepidisphaeraceae bacterium]|nr:DUF4202 domain-containing protein [Tepidisphaeraceae bacterium]
MQHDLSLFEKAIQRFDQANSHDPHGKETIYAQRMSQWLARLDPDAPEELQLAARSQHLRRWEIPRKNFPMDRAGYLNWRKTLYAFHAEKAAEILREVGYDQTIVARVQSLLRKEKIKSDPQMQTLEDVICLVFLENYFADFARDKDEEKLINILRRTWAKMSEKGRQAAMGLQFSDFEKALITKAISG